MNGSSKPSVLIVGGLGEWLFPGNVEHRTDEQWIGYVGRFLAKYIHSENLASSIRIVDKVLPQLAHLAPEFTEACSQDRFIQADASRESSMARVFDHPHGPDATWDYVFNCAGETAWSQAPEIYKLRSWQLSVTLANEAAKRKVKAFVEVSTGMVYAPHRSPRTEQDKLKPWLKLAKVKLEAEQELSRIPGLNLVILRLAHVYGEYDSKFIAKALCLARVYQEQQKELKWLWTEDLRINTVHVEDVARALWAAAQWRSKNHTIPSSSGSSSPTLSRRPTLTKGEDAPSGNVPIFNIVDHGETSQGILADVISRVFDIQTGFQGTIISSFAKMNLEHVVDDLNEDILQPWADLLESKGITKPGPLTPFLEKELLKDTDLSLDGSLFERVVEFKYNRPDGLTVDAVKEMITSYQKMEWWP